jgi:hypothetical protein
VAAHILYANHLLSPKEPNLASRDLTPLLLLSRRWGTFHSIATQGCPCTNKLLQLIVVSAKSLLSPKQLKCASRH